MNKAFLVAASMTVLLAACGATAPKSDSASTQPAPSVANAVPASPEKSAKGGTTKAGSQATGKFAKLKVGMSMGEVQNVLDRAPDRTHTYESGKRWIPFYFGSDVRRNQALFRGEGCLIFTGGNVWGAAGGELLEIQSDPSGACYQP